MQSLWETLGRMLADESFRDTILNTPSLRTANQPTKTGVGHMIPTSKYNTLLGLLTSIQYKPVSMFTQSEILRVLAPSSGPSFDTAINTVAAFVKIAGGSKDYYAALGAITFDRTFRTATFGSLANLPAAQKLGFSTLTQLEFDHLLTLATISGAGTFDAAATDLIENTSWRPVCLCRIEPYSEANQLQPDGPALKADAAQGLKNAGVA